MLDLYTQVNISYSLHFCRNFFTTKFKDFYTFTFFIYILHFYFRLMECEMVPLVKDNKPPVMQKIISLDFDEE